MTEQPTRDYKYRAFLSYRASDARQAERLHRTLEEYNVPRALVGQAGEHGVIPARLGKIYRDRDEARAAERIESVLASELAQSQHLIVLCTPSAAAADSWVPREIALFRERRPSGLIHAVIGSGAPPSCFPEALLSRTADGRIEAPLAADMRPVADGGADGEERGLIRLIASLLGVGFDVLWQREQRRRRARRIWKALEVAAVILVSVAAIALGNWYRTHVRLNVDLTTLTPLASSIRVVTSREDPNENRSDVILDQAVDGGRLARWIPASDVIVRAIAAFDDGNERALAWHLTTTSGFALSGKRVALTAPETADILSHAGMALIPAGVRWTHGSDRETRTNARGFWIDIRPPTVDEYVPQAERALATGALDRENSFILTARQQSAAVDATGLGQLRSLNQSLGDIFGAISQAESQTVSAPSDIVVGMVTLPCDRCPAPMTRVEAETYCRTRGMRLPTALEWELAVRGIDGRVYPWGNRFDPARANVVGLPEKGEQPRLKAVDAYRDQLSPYGLYDTVGNAGDWVENDVGSYERVYMGATYRYNPEDATAFRMLPITDSDYLVREITTRCVADASDGTPARPE